MKTHKVNGKRHNWTRGNCPWCKPNTDPIKKKIKSELIVWTK